MKKIESNRIGMGTGWLVWSLFISQPVILIVVARLLLNTFYNTYIFSCYIHVKYYITNPKIKENLDIRLLDNVEEKCIYETGFNFNIFQLKRERARIWGMVKTKKNRFNNDWLWWSSVWRVLWFKFHRILFCFFSDRFFWSSSDRILTFIAWDSLLNTCNFLKFKSKRTQIWNTRILVVPENF